MMLTKQWMTAPELDNVGSLCALLPLELQELPNFYRLCLDFAQLGAAHAEA